MQDFALSKYTVPEGALGTGNRAETELSLTELGSSGGCRPDGLVITVGYTKCGTDCCGNTWQGHLMRESGKASQRKISSVAQSVMPSISSSVIPFSSCPQSLPASESFPMSQLFTWGGQSTGVSALASFLPEKPQGWSPSKWTGWISLQRKIGSFKTYLYSRWLQGKDREKQEE